MTVASLGLYLFYWFYLTWKQYRDHTRVEAYPVWHALTLFVPIYGYFRMHAHVRTFDELMHSASISSTLSRGGAVFALVVLSILNFASIRLVLGDVTGGVAFALFLIDAVAVAITIVLILQLQENLNRYWDSLSNTAGQDARIGVGEVIFAIIGVLSWLDALFTLFSESYRTGTL